MSAPLGQYGSQTYESPESRALGSISLDAYSKVYDDQGAFLSKLASDNSYMAAMMRKQQRGIDQANQNFVQQIQATLNDVIVIMGGGSFGDSGIDFGDLKYVLEMFGALFGFSDVGGIPLPLNVFNAAWNFFSQYIFPADNFQEVIDTIIDGVIATMLTFLGDIPIVGQAAEQLAVIISDIRDLLGPVATALDDFMQSFGVDYTDPTQVDDFFGPLKPIFDSLTTALAGINLPDFTPMFAAFAQWTEPFITLVADVINTFAPILNDTVTLAGDVITPVVDLITPVITAIAPIIGIVGDVVNGLDPILEGITTVVNALSPIIDDVTGVVETINPIIDEVTSVVGDIGPIVDDVTGVVSMFGVGTAPSDFNPTTAIENLITNFINPSGLISGASADFTDIIDELTGLTGGTLPDVGTWADNLGSLLGGINLSSGSFDPIAAGTQMLSEVLTPAGALSTLTQVPSHLLGNLVGIPSSIEAYIPVGWTGSFNNLLPDAGFSNASALDQSTIWNWDGTVDNTGVTGSGSATTHANSLLKELMAVPIKTAPSQTHFIGIFVKWAGLSATSGTAIELLANAFDAQDNLLSITPVSGIASPGASSAGYSGTDAINSLRSLSANSNNFVLISGTFQAPSNAMFIRLSARILANVTAGQVWLDDGIHAMQGTVDAGSIGNVANMPQLPFGNVQGIQGLADIGSSLGHTLDQFMNALNNTTGAAGTSIAAVANALNDLATTANQALSIAQTASGMVGSTTTNFNNAGPGTLPIPTNMQVSGRKFDLIALGGGGAGDGEYGAPVESAGGSAGVWASRTVTYGTEIPLGTTTLSVNVGTGGQGATGYFENGTNGNPTTISLPGGTVLLTAGGGTHGANTAGTGLGPGNYSYNGVSYPGGATVSTGANGSAPGGGGSGALPFSVNSGNGAPGYAGIVMRTP